ncbi:MAG: 1,4-dihydroxy-2-naphthoate octaprenyltransferase, partial [Puniceicoccales bacterium]
MPAAIAPVAVGSALAVHDGVFNAAPAAICLAFALLIQIGTNYANDYFDFIKGADTAERIGPTRAVAAGLVTPAAMRMATILVLALAFIIGLFLVNWGGWPLVIIGVVSIVCAVAYTGGPFPLGYNGLGDLFVFIFFGLVAVGFTYFVQAGAFSGVAWLLGAGVGALSTN